MNERFADSFIWLSIAHCYESLTAQKFLGTQIPICVCLLSLPATEKNFQTRRSSSFASCRKKVKAWWAAITQPGLSARAYHGILKVARSISDLAGSEEIQSVHWAEALP